MIQDPIPFSPPHIDEETIAAVSDVLRSGWITTGPKTRELEKRIGEYTGVDHVICLNSWTNACELFLRWWGIGPGDEVLVPAYTYAASANIVHHLGAKAVLMDSMADDPLVNAEIIQKHLSPKTKVVMPVDVGGMPVDYDEIMKVLKAHSFSSDHPLQAKLGRPLLLGDAAHSFGAIYKGRKVGAQADITGFSFHAVKNLTTAEGGALCLNLPDPFDNAELWKDLNRLSLHGQSKDAMAKTQGTGWRYDILEHGYKCNLTDVHAAIGLVEMGRYEKTLATRKSICEKYTAAFEKFDWAICPSFTSEQAESSYHLYMLRIEGAGERKRDEIIRRIQEQGIAVNVHFQPLPVLTAYQQHGWKPEDFPNAMSFYENEISLPVFVGLQDEQIERIVATVNQAVSL